MSNAPFSSHPITMAVVGSTLLLILLISSQKRLSPAQEHSPTDNAMSGQLSIAYARASLRLAKAELAEAQEENRRYKNSVTQYDIERLRLRLRAAEQNVSYAEQGADASQSILGHVELQSRLAELELRIAQELHQNNVEFFSEPQLERLQAYAELFRLRVELVRHPVSPIDLIEHLHWETHRLSEEILLLSRRIERLEETARQ